MEAGRRLMLHETPRGVGGYLAVFTGQQTVHAIEGEDPRTRASGRGRRWQAACQPTTTSLIWMTGV
jgi:hypothetical protein